jgi:hypothetical protein
MNTPEDSVGEPNPYVLSFLTATLAGVFAVVGGHYAAKFQGREAVVQKQLEFRVKAYESFLEADRIRSPSLSRLMILGGMADRFATDGEFQAFETQAAALLKKVDTKDLHAQFNAECNLLRLHGSSRVVTICDDLIRVWLVHDDEIQWSEYPLDVQSFRAKWKPSEAPREAYGVDPKLSDADRWRIFALAKLRALLFAQLRSETQQPSTS